MNELLNFDRFAMLQPKTDEDRLTVLREIHSELDNVLAHLAKLGEDRPIAVLD